MLKCKILMDTTFSKYLCIRICIDWRLKDTKVWPRIHFVLIKITQTFPAVSNVLRLHSLFHIFGDGRRRTSPRIPFDNNYKYVWKRNGVISPFSPHRNSTNSPMFPLFMDDVNQYYAELNESFRKWNSFESILDMFGCKRSSIDRDRIHLFDMHVKRPS